MKKAILVMLCLFLSARAYCDAIYTDEGSFLAQLGTSYLEDFPGYAYASPGLGATLDGGPVNGYSWQASASDSGGLFAVDQGLSTSNAVNLVITFTGAPVTAFGGIFTSTELSGATIPQDIVVTLSNGTNYTLNGSGWVGFTTDLPIASVTIDGIDGTYPNFPAVDHMYVGAAVPEPGTAVLLCMGAIGAAIYRRKRS
ncbi:MAG TPA: PEP-CTERM sorting domain-containing protein [Candidatus Brocadiia bacterium]|nr:PEP-CTERM sorting domain-containing protein [Candidatus Brocadiia bacterium]